MIVVLQYVPDKEATKDIPTDEQVPNSSTGSKVTPFPAYHAQAVNV